ncbi:hypothetical protein GCM10027162_30980 [Streptomyces incanus]
MDGTARHRPRNRQPSQRALTSGLLFIAIGVAATNLNGIASLNRWITDSRPSPELCFPQSCKRAAGLRARHDCVPRRRRRPRDPWTSARRPSLEDPAQPPVPKGDGIHHAKGGAESVAGRAVGQVREQLLPSVLGDA